MKILPLIEDYEKEYDNLGHKLSAQQSEFFKNSKVRNREGKLIVCYHGTSKRFNTFSKEKFRSGYGGMQYGAGFYFTGNKWDAMSYGGLVRPVYLNF